MNQRQRVQCDKKKQKTNVWRKKKQDKNKFQLCQVIVNLLYDT